MSVCRSTYQGDQVLARMLRKAGAELTVAGARDLVAGVLAAPEDRDAGLWVELVVPSPSPALRAQLVALKAEMKRARDDDLKRDSSPDERLGTLRAELARRELSGFIVPRADEHQGEWVPPRAERLAWLTGFTGSAGVAVVLAEPAALFVDGRYTLQVRAQVDERLYEFQHLTDSPPDGWIARNLSSGGRLGYDPWLHTQAGLARLRKACAKADAELVVCADNPLDAVWTDQPPPPIAPVVPHELGFAGRSSAEKREELAAKLTGEGVEAAVLTAPDSIAWLLNIRGGDVPYAPLPLAFALLHRDGVVGLFIDRRKLSPGLAGHLGKQVTVEGPDGFGPALDRLGATGARVQVDPESAASWVFDRLEAAGATVVRAADPCLLPKACKNQVELDGARAAHLRDGVALTRFLAWLAREAPKGGLTEIAAAERLAAFREEGELFRGPSFETISGAGPNGAIVHYRATPETDRRLEPDSLYLVDSGAQYLDGTTDVTRTVFIGKDPPGAEVRDRFTRVVKGHIAIATARFPRGTTGPQLDALARRALWEVGLDYDHGTGHGVGSHLGVHEGPQRISKIPNTVALEPGMICSNEPGYYKTGSYGIRIENLVTVVVDSAVAGAEKEVLAFETLTAAPIDLALIEPALMDGREIAWLDAYHARVREALSPLLDPETAAWLAQATAPVGKG